MSRNALALTLPALILAVPFALPSRAVAADKEYSYFFDADDDKMFDIDFHKLIKAKLGNSYQNLQILVTACNSGGFAEEATGVLQGTWSVTTSRDKDKHQVEYEHTLARYKDEDGLKITTNNKDLYYYGFTPAWMKKVRETPAATASTLHQYATDHDVFTDVNPQFAKAGGGENSTLFNGTKGNHAILWSAHQNDSHDFPYAVSTELYKTLKGVGYTDATIDFALQNFQNDDTLGVHVDRKATVANLGTMLADMRTSLNLDPQQRKSTIIISAHGNTDTRKAELMPNAIPGQLRQGIAVASGGGTSIDVTSNFADRFFEEIGAIDNPEWARAADASVMITTSEETFSGPVTISLDNDPIGTIVMNGSSSGHTYEIPLDDALMNQLLADNVLGDLHANLSFSFSGSPGAFFRVATQWDWDAGIGPDHFGVSLVAPPGSGDAHLPEPAACVVFVASAALASMRRRR